MIYTEYDVRVRVQNEQGEGYWLWTKKRVPIKFPMRYTPLTDKDKQDLLEYEQRKCIKSQ